MSLTVWKKINEAPYNVGHRRLMRRLFERPDGQLAEFILLNGEAAVCIVPFTPDNRVILARQFRPGPEKIITELPGGGIDPGETPEAAAQRELLEETGYEGDLTYLGQTVYAYSVSGTHCFVATNCRRLREPTTTDPNEIIEVVEMTLDEFKTHLRGGELSNVGAGFLGLLHLGLL